MPKTRVVIVVTNWVSQDGDLKSGKGFEELDPRNRSITSLDCIIDASVFSSRSTTTADCLAGH